MSSFLEYFKPVINKGETTPNQHLQTSDEGRSKSSKLHPDFRSVSHPSPTEKFRLKSQKTNLDF